MGKESTMKWHHRGPFKTDPRCIYVADQSGPFSPWDCIPIIVDCSGINYRPDPCDAGRRPDLHTVINDNQHSDSESDNRTEDNQGKAKLIHQVMDSLVNTMIGQKGRDYRKKIRKELESLHSTLSDMQ